MMGLKLPLVVLVVVVLLVLRWRRAGMLAWAFAWWLGLFVVFRFGFAVPIPRSVVTLYMAIVTGSLLAYVGSSRERWRGFFSPIERLVLEPRLRPALAAVLLLIPGLMAASVYARLTEPLEAPAFGRTVHPSPPDQITVHEKTHDLRAADNPYRGLAASNPEEFARHVENGRRVYYQNCFFCHGDGLAGNGMFAHALNPIPSNFTDQGVLPMFQESFFMWRISKGGPGLPEEAGPWDTAMPAWEKFLTEEEIWDVIAFLYDFTGYQPRKLGEEAHE